MKRLANLLGSVKLLGAVDLLTELIHDNVETSDGDALMGF